MMGRAGRGPVFIPDVEEEEEAPLVESREKRFDIRRPVFGVEGALPLPLPPLLSAVEVRASSEDWDATAFDAPLDRQMYNFFQSVWPARRTCAQPSMRPW